MEYKVVLETFEGPIDLLYHLIEKNEVDIYDIPISEITHQYIEYIENMKELDLNVTSEFLLMIATLIEIKSKMLLPSKKEIDGEQLKLDEVDPREELVRRLIEYKKYKTASEELKSKEILQKKVFFKPQEEIEGFIVESKPDFDDLNLEDLITAFSKILKKSKNNAPKIDFHEIHRDEITIEESMENILNIVKIKRKIKFEDLFNDNLSKSKIVVTFLSILELIKLNKIVIKQEGNFKDIMILNTNN